LGLHLPTADISLAFGFLRKWGIVLASARFCIQEALGVFRGRYTIARVPAVGLRIGKKGVKANEQSARGGTKFGSSLKKTSHYITGRFGTTWGDPSTRRGAGNHILDSAKAVFQD